MDSHNSRATESDRQVLLQHVAGLIRQGLGIQRGLDRNSTSKRFTIWIVYKPSSCYSVARHSTRNYITVSFKSSSGSGRLITSRGKMARWHDLMRLSLISMQETQGEEDIQSASILTI